MVKLASESVDTEEKRQGLPSEEAQKSHMAHQAFQLPTSDASTFEKASEPFCERDQNVPRLGVSATVRRYARNHGLDQNVTEMSRATKDGLS